jgi:long-chain acyl-CoA synthetase
MSLPAAFKSARDRNGGKRAIVFGDASCTYSEFDRLTDNVAGNLLAADLEPGDRIAVHLLNGMEAALAYVGCLKAGCIAVPINTRLKGREIDYILRHSGAASYLGQPELHADLRASCPAIAGVPCYLTGASAAGIVSFDGLLRTPHRTAPLPEIAPDHTAAILYTSGTTAHPKGVVHSHRSLLQTARTMHQVRLDEDQVVLVMSSMAHLVGFGMLFLSALVNGATTVITRPFEFDTSLEAYERWKCTYTFTLPVMLQGLLTAQAAAPRNVSSGEFYFCGGDSVSPVLQEAFARSFAPVCEAYGSTEIAPSSWNRPREVRVGSIGKPGDEVAFRLIDSNSADVHPGGVGELCVRGPHLMTGYWQDSEATSAALREGWFRSGDLASCDGDGFYWFAGRKKEIIIRGGSNISPQEVEAVLYEHPAVAEAGVVGRPDALWRETVVAHVALRKGRRLDEEELIAFARERLADYKTPQTVIFHSELPKGATGKIQRRALRETEHAAAVEV